jgi:hypothetical protein
MVYETMLRRGVRRVWEYKAEEPDRRESLSPMLYDLPNQ